MSDTKRTYAPRQAALILSEMTGTAIDDRKVRKMLRASDAYTGERTVWNLTDDDLTDLFERITNGGGGASALLTKADAAKVAADLKAKAKAKADAAKAKTDAEAKTKA